MWVFLTDAFFSIVDKKAKDTMRFNSKPTGADLLVVRARLPDDIQRVFGDCLGRKIKVTTSAINDYRYRANIKREDVVRVLSSEVWRIQYGNFKNEVAEPERHLAYSGVWGVMESMQHRLHAPRGPKPTEALLFD